jgi:hypothetical protein
LHLRSEGICSKPNIGYFFFCGSDSGSSVNFRTKPDADNRTKPGATDYETLAQWHIDNRQGGGYPQHQRGPAPVLQHNEIKLRAPCIDLNLITLMPQAPPSGRAFRVDHGRGHKRCDRRRIFFQSPEIKMHVILPLDIFGMRCKP